MVRSGTYSAMADASDSARSPREAAISIGARCRETAAAAKAALAETDRSGTTTDWCSSTAIALAIPGSSSKWSMRCEKAIDPSTDVSNIASLSAAWR